MSRRTLLIDGDTFVFTAASANEYETRWSDWMWTLHADLHAGIAHLDSILDEVVEGMNADKVIVALTDTTNWRKAVMPTYKLNRVAKRKPVIYQPLRNYIAEKFTTYQRPGLEGDDVLGILTTHPTMIAGEKIVVSIDKDMQTLPGLLLNYGRAKKAILADGGTYADCITEVSVANADLYHMTQTLTGDTTDGYPGCPGVGKVGAEKLLAPFTEDAGRFDVGRAWREAVLPAYAKKGLGEEVALQNARVARILRHTDYDLHKREVKLWMPPSPQ